VEIVKQEMLEAVARARAASSSSDTYPAVNEQGRGEVARTVDERILRGRRNTTLASLAGRMRYAGFEEEAIFAALQAINEERCKPPLEPGEVRRIARSIARYEPGPWVSFQRLVTNEPPEPPILSAAPKKEVAAESNLTFYTGPEIAAMAPDEPEWIVESYVAKSAITDVNGKPKAAGKTTWALYLSSKVLGGEPFMDLATMKTGVLYLTEQSASTDREALDRAGLLDREELAVLFWRDTIGVNWPEIVHEAAEEAVRRDAQLLIVDTLPQFAGLKGDAENSATGALTAMQPLQEVAATYNLAIIIVRHERKSGGQVGVAGRGSTAFAGAVDLIVSIRRSEGAARPTIRELHALSRFDETPDVLVVELTESGYRALGDKAAVAESEAREAILEAAPTSEARAVSLNFLLMVTDLGRSSAQKAIEALLEAGELRRVGAGVKGSPYRYWRPTSPDEPPNDPTIQDGQMRSAATHTLEEAERKTDAAGERSESYTDDSFTPDLSDTQEGSSPARSHDGDRGTEMPENNCEANAEDHFSPGYYAVTKTVMVGGKEICVYGAEHASRPPGTKLAELGWARNEKAARGRKRSPANSSGAEGGLDVNQDHVACMIRGYLGWRFDGVAAVTAGDVWCWQGEHLTPTELIGSWPKDWRAMHKHLRRLAPVLRTTKQTYRFSDEDGVRRGDPFAVKTREGHMDVQYWEKGGGEVEGVWVFAAELATLDDPENVERCVWKRVKHLEGIVEDDSDWPDDRGRWRTP
jgi:hypothetical protein